MTPATKASAWAVIPCGPFPPANRFLESSHRLKWMWRPLPTSPTMATGANDARYPCCAETPRMVCREWLSLLGELVRGRPRPSRLGGQRTQDEGVRHEAEVSHRPSQLARGGEEVVHQVDVEDRGEPDAEPGGPLQEGDGHGLDQ